MFIFPAGNEVPYSKINQINNEMSMILQSQTKMNINFMRIPYGH
jgi:hypothetical protein